MLFNFCLTVLRANVFLSHDGVSVVKIYLRLQVQAYFSENFSRCTEALSIFEKHPRCSFIQFAPPCTCAYLLSDWFCRTLVIFLSRTGTGMERRPVGYLTIFWWPRIRKDGSNPPSCLLMKILCVCISHGAERFIAVRLGVFAHKNCVRRRLGGDGAGCRRC